MRKGVSWRQSLASVPSEKKYAAPTATIAAAARTVAGYTPRDGRVFHVQASGLRRTSSRDIVPTRLSDKSRTTGASGTSRPGAHAAAGITDETKRYRGGVRASTTETAVRGGVERRDVEAETVGSPPASAGERLLSTGSARTAPPGHDAEGAGR